MHSIDVRYMSTQAERSYAQSRMLKSSHLGATTAFEAATQTAPLPQRRPGWRTVFPRFASAR